MYKVKIETDNIGTGIAGFIRHNSTDPFIAYSCCFRGPDKRMVYILLLFIRDLLSCQLQDLIQLSVV